jgi:hypothetical protein
MTIRLTTAKFKHLSETGQRPGLVTGDGIAQGYLVHVRRHNSKFQWDGSVGSQSVTDASTWNVVVSPTTVPTFVVRAFRAVINLFRWLVALVTGLKPYATEQVTVTVSNGPDVSNDVNDTPEVIP